MASNAELSRLERSAATLRARLNEFEAARQDLLVRRELAEGDARLMADIDALLDRTAAIEARVSAVHRALTALNSALASVGEWWRGVWGLDGLGVAPVVAVAGAAAAITAATAAITKWLSDYKRVEARLNFISEQTAAGVPLDRAIDAANAADGPTITGTLGKVGGALAIAALIYAAAKAAEAIK